ncbi:MAG: hypothetical protein ABSC19_11945 [Syntrophorhabdales bacterium]
MRRTVVLVISCLFLFCLFHPMTVAKTFLLCLSMTSAYIVSRVPPRYLLASKYPLIGFCLALPCVLIFYPALRPYHAIAGAAMFFAFYGMALFLVTTEDKGREVYKEVLGLSLLYGASCLNLVLTGHSELILPQSISVLVFLFIINRVRIMPFIAAYTVVCMIFLAVKGVSVLGQDVLLQNAERYTLLACAFALLLMTFVAFLKRTDFISVLAFFGLLYVSVDLLMSVGFRLKGVLLYQPVAALFIMGPLVGMIMKGGKERA